MWSKICHVETFLHMINVETIFFVTIHADLSRNLLCCHLRCIGAKSILSRFTHFCVEKNLFRNCACGEKRTNIRYGYRAARAAKNYSVNGWMVAFYCSNCYNILDFFSLIVAVGGDWLDGGPPWLSIKMTGWLGGRSGMVDCLRFGINKSKSKRKQK